MKEVSNSLIFRGVVALLVGLVAILLPGPTLFSIALLFGAYLFVDGISSVISAFQLRKRSESWGFTLFQGVLGIAAGVAAVTWPGITVLVLTGITAAWALMTGVAEVVAASRMRWLKRSSRVLLAVAGILSVLLGAAMVTWPALGILTLLTLVAIYAFMSGTILIMLGAQTRKLTPVERFERSREPGWKRAA